MITFLSVAKTSARRASRSSKGATLLLSMMNTSDISVLLLEKTW